LIAEEQLLIAEALSALISMNRSHTNIVMVGIANSSREAVRQAQTSAPDLILMGITREDIADEYVTFEIKKLLPEIKVAVLSSSHSIFQFLNALSMGADGYFLKSSSYLTLAHNIKQVTSGIKVFEGLDVFQAARGNTRLAQITRPQARQQGVDADQVYTSAEEPEVSDGAKNLLDRSRTLSQREVIILKMIAAGYKNREIALLLNRSKRTIENQRLNLLRKLGSPSMSQLFQFAHILNYDRRQEPTIIL